MPAWLLPAALGALSAGGEIMTNRSNRNQSREQMRFQERMSSTSAQRAVADYTKAGLNPALAYDRGASSPSGASATMQNPASAGLNSGLSARALVQSLKLTEAQTTNVESQTAKTNTEVAVMKHDLGLRETTLGGEPSWRDEQMARRGSAIRDMKFTGTLQPHQLKLAQLQALLAGTDVNRKALSSSLFGSARDVEGFIRRGFSRLPDAASAAKAWAPTVFRGGVLDPNSKWRRK